MTGDSDRHLPEDLQVPDVGKRVTDGRQFPVEDRAHFVADERKVACDVEQVLARKKIPAAPATESPQKIIKKSTLYRIRSALSFRPDFDESSPGKEFPGECPGI